MTVVGHWARAHASDPNRLLYGAAVGAMILLGFAILQPLADRVELRQGAIAVRRLGDWSVIPFAEVVAVVKRPIHGLDVRTARCSHRTTFLRNRVELHAKLRAILPMRCFPAALEAPFEARVPAILPTLASTLLLLLALATLYLHFGIPRSSREGSDVSFVLALFALVGFGWMATRLPLRLRVSATTISIRYAICTRVLLVIDLTRVDLTGGTATAPTQVLKLATRRARVTLRDGELNLPVAELHSAIVRLRERAVGGPRSPFR